MLDFSVVGVGSSAGGIGALQRLFKALPKETGLAFVVVQHLSPTHESRLVWLLREATALRVEEAVNGTVLQRDHVYVIAPGQELTLANGLLWSRPRPTAGVKALASIDTFFESLAVDQRERAIGVVLSGAGSDGAAGAIQIKMAGGTVFVQDPTTASYDSMPRAALATGAPDGAFELDALARALCTDVGSRSRADRDTAWRERSEQALDQIRRLVRAHAGIDLAAYKPTPLLWRIRRRMDFRRLDSLSEYATYLARNSSEAEALVRGIPIHVTSFFRDVETWAELSRSVLAPLLAERAGGSPIRAWTAACSSGEEAYSLAMLLSELAALEQCAPDYQVFATDVSADIVARAGRGWFPASAAEALSPERRERFFDRVDDGFRVKNELRSKLVFARHDLLNDPPFSNLDVVTCRNLLIYMDPPAQEQVLALLGSALRGNGVLLLGSGEALDLTRQRFATMSQRHRLYRKLASEEATAEAPAAHLSAPAEDAAVAERSHLALVTERGQPAVLVDAELSLLHVYGDMDAFLHLPSGEPLLGLMSLARPGLAAHVKSAVQRALDERRPATTRGLWDGPRGVLPLSTRVTPITADGSLRLLISFQAELSAAPASEAPATPRRWEREDIASSEASLRLSTEELEASREELHAVNEQLRSVNDQLSFVNERLASTNERLNTSNDQLQLKILELETQSRVLSSGAVMTLFLDEQLCVRWFTPALRELMPVLPADVGRPIMDLVTRLHDPSFLDEVHAVLASGEPREDEVMSRSGSWYLRRIGPHAPSPGHPAGVVVTFTDVTARRNAESAAREHQQRLRLALDAAAMGTFIWHPDEDRAEPDARMLAIFGQPPDGTLSLNGVLATLIHPDDRERHARAVALACDPARDGVLKEDLRLCLPDGSERWVMLEARVHFEGEPRRPKQMAGAAIDITERKLIEAVVRANEARQAFLLQLADALRPLTDAADIEQRVTHLLGERLTASRSYYAIFDLERGEAELLRDYCAHGVQSLVGVYRLQEFGQVLAPAMQGSTMLIEDVECHPGLPRAEREGLLALSLRSFVGAPVVKGGKVLGVLVVASATARAWSSDEASLIKEVAERTWDAISRGNAELALRDSEQRFRLLVQTAAQATWEADAHGVVVHDSPSWRAYTGQTLEEWLGRGWVNAIHPDDRARCEQEWRDAVAAAGEMNAEFRLRNRSGGYAWTNMRAAPVRDPDGTISRWLGMNIDISDRKQSERRVPAG